MSKAQETRDKILQQAAELFNQQGYAGSSMSDLMRATGLQKGGIYNHFESKQALALAAFDFAFQCLNQRFATALQGKRHAIDRLQALIDLYSDFIEHPPIAGGCPVLNLAIESDDTNPILRDRVCQALDQWRNLIIRIVNRGIDRQEIRATVDADKAATLIISTLEGAIMMSKLYQTPLHLERAIEHLTDYVQTLRS
jgi:TetR/AcrR family transcriptional regulator, transcriptional repressor for nem operon